MPHSPTLTSPATSGIHTAPHVSVSLTWLLLRLQVAEEVFTLSRVVRTFSTEGRETARYVRSLGRLRRISVRLATAYLLYLVTNASLFNLTKVRVWRQHA